MTSSSIFFTPVDSVRAFLRIKAPPASEFTVTGQGDYHQIGFPDAPILEMMEAPSPDDAIEIERLAGRLIGPASAALDPAVSGWVPAHARDDVAAILQHLPPGHYWVLRSARRIGKPGPVMLGNEMVDADRSLREVHYGDYHYVLAVGATAGVDPDLTRPLLGVTILNYTGQGTTQAVWLLTPLAPREGSIEVESDDSLFIIPVSGPLVLDHLEKFSAASSARCRKLWAEKGARALARDLTTGPAHRSRR
jgi:hypothetical protein